MTLSFPRASVQSAATTELSLPPEIATTALHPGPFCSNQLRIHATSSSFTFPALNAMKRSSLSDTRTMPGWQANSLHAIVTYKASIRE